MRVLYGKTLYEVSTIKIEQEQILDNVVVTYVITVVIPTPDEETILTVCATPSDIKKLKETGYIDLDKTY